MISKQELEQKIKASLPQNWEFSHLKEYDNDDKWLYLFVVQCPIEEVPVLFENHDDFLDKINQIKKDTNSSYDGGGWSVGKTKYDNYFYILKNKNKGEAQMQEKHEFPTVPLNLKDY